MRYVDLYNNHPLQAKLNCRNLPQIMHECYENSLKSFLCSEESLSVLLPQLVPCLNLLVGVACAKNDV